MARVPFPNVPDEPLRRNFEAIESALIAAGIDLQSLAAIVPTAGDFKPSAKAADHEGWLICDGVTAYPEATSPELYVLLSGSGGFFHTPDLRDRTLFGAGSLAAGANDGRALGLRGPSHVLTEDEMPRHRHSQQSDTLVANSSAHWAYPSTSPFSDISRGGLTNYVGGDDPHDHGFYVVNWFIKT